MEKETKKFNTMLKPNPETHIEKINVKCGGDNWRFHKNDKDPFPSQPHGHNHETGEKLDTNSGTVYDRNKRPVRQIGKKNLSYVNSELDRRGYKTENH